MMHNTQASKLVERKKRITTASISIKKEHLKQLKKNSIIKIDAKELEVFINQQEQTIKASIFFQDSYFYIHNKSLLSSPKRVKKLSKSSFVLEFDYVVPFALGRYLLHQERLACIFVSKNIYYNASLVFRKDAFFIEIEG